MAEGTLLGLYRFKKYVSKPPENGDIESFTIVESDADKLAALELGAQRGAILAESTNFGRDLINEPGNVAHPTYLAAQAEALAKEFGLELTILDRGQMEEMGMGSILAVAQGSAQPPKLICLRYWGAGKETTPAVAFIGKAVMLR